MIIFTELLARPNRDVKVPSIPMLRNPMKQSLPLMMLSLLFITSCGLSGPDRKNGAKETEIKESQIQLVMSKQKMECDSLYGQDCPEAVARLLIINKKSPKKSKLCSGFMVGEDTMVTNEHCISSKADCSNTHVAIYDGNSYLQSKCASVVKIIKDKYKASNPKKNLDVTIVKLTDRYYGKTFKIAERRPMPNEDLYAWVVDHTGNDSKNGNLVESRITQFKCTVASSSPWKALTLLNCPVVHGNSGSPIVNSSGEIVGIIWGGTADKMDSTYPLEKRRQTSFLAAATEALYFSKYITQ